MAYMLRVRFSDDQPWGPPTPYISKKERDSGERYARCLGGFRTHTWRETKAEEQARLAEGDANAHD